jgi:uncharacterized membrane protein
MKNYKPINNFLSADDLREIEKAVEDEEKTTSGEIKVVVVAKSRRGLFRVFDPLKAVEMRAIREFKKMGVHKTEERTGVLILVSVAERRIRIIADEGIHSRVEDGVWDRIVEMISLSIKNGRQKEGIISAVARVGEILSAHFPSGEGGVNEISNEVVIEK